MRKNDAFDAKIVNTWLTKIFIAIFAPDERLPSSATLDSIYISPYSIHFQAARTKNKKVSIFWHLWFFITLPIFFLSLSRYNFKTEAWSPKPIIFSESWVRSWIPSVLALKNFAVENFWGRSVSPKKSLSRWFPCPFAKQNKVGVWLRFQIFLPWTKSVN